MKPIEKDELYHHLTGFLKGKGIEIKEGSYTKGIHAGCSLLADAINLSQRGIERARTEIDKKVDQVRQVIHEKTAPNRGERPKKAAPQNSKAAAQGPPIMRTAAPRSKPKGTSQKAKRIHPRRKPARRPGS